MSTSWVGSFLLRVVVVVALFFSVSASAQTPSLIEPYEVLYGKPQRTQHSLSPEKMKPSPASLALVQARTETMLARLGSVASTLRSGIGPQKLQRWGVNIRRNRAEAEILRDRGKHYAAWWKATLNFMEAEFLSGILEAVAAEASQQEGSGGTQVSRLSEVRARLNAFYTRLEVVPVTSVSVALALSEGYATWMDMTSLQNLLEGRPAELLAMFQLSGPPIPAERQERFVRLVMEPIFIPIIQWGIEESELLLQASQADATSPMRLDEVALRQLARAYSDAAQANRQLTRLRAEGQSFPDRGPGQEFANRLTGRLADESLSFVRQHREDKGMAGALLLVGTSRHAYAASLGSLAETQVQLDPAVATAPDATSAEREMDRLRLNRLVDAEQQARAVAAQANAVLGSVPALVSLNYTQGQELQEGSIEDRELALTELLDARTLAELAVGLGAAVPRDAVPLTSEDESQAKQQLILACIERLRLSETSTAMGYLFKKAPQLEKADIESMIAGATLTACTRARNYQSSVRPLFWKILKNELADWFREVAVFERAAPKLTAVCEDVAISPEDELGKEQVCSLLHQAMGQLSDSDRTIIELKFEQGLKLEGIGQKLNITAEAARQRLNRALAKLRKFYQDRDVLSLSWLLRSLLGRDRWVQHHRSENPLTAYESTT